MTSTRVAFVIILGASLFLDSPSIAEETKETSKLQGPPGVTYKGGDGHDCKQAVIIKGAKGEAQEVEAEAKWLESRYPGYTKFKQRTTGNFSVGATGTTIGPMYDLITITTAEGQDNTVCFGFKPPKTMFKPAESTH